MRRQEGGGDRGVVRAIFLARAPRTRERKEGNVTRVAPVLPECARKINQMVKSWAVLPPWAQQERHGCHSHESLLTSI